MASEYVLKEGNERVILCERGIRTHESAYRFTLDLLAVPALREMTHLPVDRRPEPRRRAARLGRADVAGRRRGRCRWHHRRGARRARRSDLRRPPGAARGRVRRLRGAPARGRGAGRRAPPVGEAVAALLSRTARASMKIAVLGVGLIGGSIGLAARERLGAEVSGFDPDPETLEARARGRRRRPARATRWPRPSADADAVFCAAPVNSLPGLVAEALAAQRTRTRRHRRRLDEGGPGRGGRRARRRRRGSSAATRSPGPRPRASRNSRADLFDGARWYLTPTRDLRGRALRPPAQPARRPRRPAPGDRRRRARPDDGDGQPPAARARQRARRRARSETLAGGERRPELGRSFRDTTRVAGANPAIWADIFAANADRVADEVDAVDRPASGGLARCSASGDSRSCSTTSRRAAEDRRAARARGARGRPSWSSSGSRVANRPGVVAELALALGPRRRQHRGHEPRSVLGHAHRRDLAVDRGHRRGRARAARSSPGSATARRRSAAARRPSSEPDGAAGRFEPAGPAARAPCGRPPTSRSPIGRRCSPR